MHVWNISCSCWGSHGHMQYETQRILIENRMSKVCCHQHVHFNLHDTKDVCVDAWININFDTKFLSCMTYVVRMSTILHAMCFVTSVHGHFYNVFLWLYGPRLYVDDGIYIPPFVASSLAGSKSCTHDSKSTESPSFPTSITFGMHWLICICWHLPSSLSNIQSSSPTSLDHLRRRLVDNAMEMRRSWNAPCHPCNWS